MFEFKQIVAVIVLHDIAKNQVTVVVITEE